MRPLEEILAEMEMKGCPEKGKRHSFKKDGPKQIVFYDGKCSGAFFIQKVTCSKCGNYRFRTALEVVKVR